MLTFIIGIIIGLIAGVLISLFASERSDGGIVQGAFGKSYTPKPAVQPIDRGIPPSNIRSCVRPPPPKEIIVRHIYQK